MTKTERYKPYFSEQKKVEGTTSTLALLEETIKIKSLLKEEDTPEETIQEETPEVSPDLMSSEEDPQDVAEEGITELLVSIIQKYGMDSEVIDKLLTLGRGLKDDLGQDSSDIVDEIDESEAPVEDDGDTEIVDQEDQIDQEDLGDQGESLESLLQTYGGGEEAPTEESPEQIPEEPSDLEAPQSEEQQPTEETPPEEQSPEEQSQEISDQEEAEAKLKDEEEKPLDLADFSFKL